MTDAVDSGVDVTCTALSDAEDVGVNTQEYTLLEAREGVDPGVTLTLLPNPGVDIFIVSIKECEP